jgi:hypothetical protein
VRTDVRAVVLTVVVQVIGVLRTVVGRPGEVRVEVLADVLSEVFPELGAELPERVLGVGAFGGVEWVSHRVLRSLFGAARRSRCR